MEDEEAHRVPRERHHPMPLPRAVHELFLNCVRTRDTFPMYPSGPELKAAGFPKPRGGHSRREQFKTWAERMDVRYDLQTKTEVLVYRRTGKIILSVEDFEAVVRQVHCERHLDWKKTMDLLQKRYTVSGRDFGIDRHTIRLVLETCPECLKKRSLVSQNGLDDLQCSRQCNGFRFPNSYSMVAHMPDLECIWFDSKGVGPQRDWFSQLMSVLNEIRGEIGATCRNNKEAKDRLITKICFAQNLVRAQKTVCEEAFHTSDCNQVFVNDMGKLYQEYKTAGRQKQYVSDMVMLMDTYKSVGYKTTFLQSILPIVKTLLLGEDRKLNGSTGAVCDVPR